MGERGTLSKVFDRVFGGGKPSPDERTQPPRESNPTSVPVEKFSTRLDFLKQEDERLLAETRRIFNRESDKETIDDLSVSLSVLRTLQSRYESQQSGATVQRLTEDERRKFGRGQHLVEQLRGQLRNNLVQGAYETLSSIRLWRVGSVDKL